MGTQYMNLQDAQKARAARPQQAKRRNVLGPYGEPLSAARTPLADFFRILLERSDDAACSDRIDR